MVEDIRNPHRKDGEPRPRFTVRTEGSAALVGLLTQMRRVSEHPGMGSHDFAMGLGTLPLRDGTLSEIDTDLEIYPSGSSYNFAVKFVTPSAETAQPHPFMIGGMGPEGVVFPPQMHLAPQRPDSHEDAVSIASVVDKLESDPEFSAAYSITYRRQGETYSITKVGDDESETEFTLAQHDRRDRYNELAPIALRCKDVLSEEGIERFTDNYQKIAKYTGSIVNALYSVTESEVPEELYVLSPPRNVKKQTEVFKKQIDEHDKHMSVSGSLDGGESIDELIERTIVMEQRPNVTFDDIGGNEEAKETLQSDVVGALKDPESYKRWGTTPPKGVLLYGPPGTGKTLLARAVANGADATMYSVDTADVLHSLYGRTEKVIQAIFDRARRGGPAVILFDELDALAAKRENSTEVTSRIVSVFLQNLDGLEERDSGLVVIGTTNRLDAIDPALLRPGRFGDVLAHVELPQAPAREQIFGIHRGKAEQLAERKLFVPGFDLTRIIDQTDNFSGADIKEILRRTLARKARAQSLGENPGLVTVEDIMASVSGYQRIKRDKENAHTGQYL